MGARTVAVVAANLGRDWLGVELSEDYVALAVVCGSTGAST
jgi:DNA modification methylase